jgi:hypothetical protein
MRVPYENLPERTEQFETILGEKSYFYSKTVIMTASSSTLKQIRGVALL